MRMKEWMRKDSRGPLLAALLVLAVAATTMLVAGSDAAAAGRLLGLFYVLPVITPITGWTLRRRGRSLAWLLLLPTPLAPVPILIALLSRPGQPK